jgi:hypothetical protein
MSSSEDSDVVEDSFEINPDFEDLKKNVPIPIPIARSW